MEVIWLPGRNIDSELVYCHRVGQEFESKLGNLMLTSSASSNLSGKLGS